MAAHYRHLRLDDRVKIQELLDRDVCRVRIARRLGVARSTVTREVKRGAWQPEDHAMLRPYLRHRLDTRGPHARLYLAGQAQLQADVVRAARSHRPYRMRQDRLVDWVLKRLEKGWSPQMIAGRLGREFPGETRMRVGHESLYQWICAPERASPHALAVSAARAEALSASARQAGPARTLSLAGLHP